MHKHNKTQNCKNPKVQYFKKHWHAKNQKHKNTKNTKHTKTENTKNTTMLKNTKMLKPNKTRNNKLATQNLKSEQCIKY